MMIAEIHCEHMKAWRWYWYTRGLTIRVNGQVFNAHGKPCYGTLEQAAREYGL